MLTRTQRNEKLTPIRTRSSVGHTQHAHPVMRKVRQINFIVEFATPGGFTTGAVAAGEVTTLDHEIFNDAVEGAVVVFSCVGEGDEVQAGLVSGQNMIGIRDKQPDQQVRVITMIQECVQLTFGVCSVYSSSSISPILVFISTCLGKGPLGSSPATRSGGSDLKSFLKKDMMINIALTCQVFQGVKVRNIVSEQ